MGTLITATTNVNKSLILYVLSAICDKHSGYKDVLTSHGPKLGVS